MDERSDQILNHIEEQRTQLGQNLDELEDRVRSTADWRAQFQKNPMLMLGVALGGGILLGAMVGGGSGSGRYRRRGYPASGRGRSSPSYRTGSPDLAASGMAAYAGTESEYVSTTETDYGTSGSDTSSTQYTQPQARSAKFQRESPAVRQEKERAVHTLESVKAALIAFGIDKVKEFLSEALPGFDRHMSDAERKNRTGEQFGQSENQAAEYREGSDYNQESRRIYTPTEQSGYDSGTPYRGE